MCDESETAMPYPLVAVITNPRTVTQFRPLIAKPFALPWIVTAAPGAAVNTIGATEVPEIETVTASEYVPDATSTVCPAATVEAAARIVQYGCVDVPGPESEHAALCRAT